MKKSLTALAVAAAISVPAIASADASWYGRAHVSGEMWKDQEAAVVGASQRANSIGIKGAVDTNLMDFKAVYKLEAGMVLNDTSGLVKQRDTFVGLSSKSLGTVRAGVMGSPWKGTTKAVDSMFTTSFEGRGGLKLTSGLADGTGAGKGRAIDSIMYTTPNIAGLKANAMMTFVDGAANNMAFNAVYKMKGITAFFDYLSKGDGATDKDGKASAGTAMKFGGKYSMSGIHIALQHEIDGGAMTGKSDDNTKAVTFINAGYTMGATMFGLSYGMTSESAKDAKNDHAAWAVYAKHKLDKKAMIYAGYGAASGGDNSAYAGDGTNVLAGGLSIKF
ncbi:MAG: porin [Gammaproteobacteria bacterium]|nr:porin [Gammaproteobacteria bacterium]